MPPTLLKPTPWNWSPTRLERRFRRIAANAEVLIPFWFDDPRDLIGSIPDPFYREGASAGRVITSRGVAWDGSAAGAKSASENAIHDQRDLSGFICADWQTNVEATQGLLTKRLNVTSTRDFYIHYSSSTAQLTVGQNAGGVRYATSPNLYLSTGWGTAGWTPGPVGTDENQVRWYSNGIDRGSSSAGAAWETVWSYYASAYSLSRLSETNANYNFEGTYGMLLLVRGSLSAADHALLNRDPFGLIRKELWTPDLAPSGGATGSGDVAITHTSALTVTGSEGEAGDIAISHTHTLTVTGSDTSQPAGDVAITHSSALTVTGSEGEAGDIAISHTHTLTVTGSGPLTSTRLILAAELATAAATAGLSPALISDHPPGVAPVATPALVVAPGSPWLEPGGPAGYRLRLEVVLFVGRLDMASAWDDLEAWIPVVRTAAAASELGWRSANVGIETLGGIEYVTARVLLEGDTPNP